MQIVFFCWEKSRNTWVRKATVSVGGWNRVSVLLLSAISLVYLAEDICISVPRVSWSLLVKDDIDGC